MTADQFRRQLQREAQQWQTEGLIDAGQYQQLADRYQFAQIDRLARDRFVLFVFGLGSLLLGLGVMTFVAANWQVIPRLVKLAALLLLLLGVNAGGFCLWRRSIPWQQRLGEGLLLLGGLVLGAALALVGQMFHIDGSATGLCLIWGAGVLAMSYSLALTSLGVLAILVIGVGYWVGIQSLYGAGMLPGLSWAMANMPLIAGLLFVPLAYRCRSRFVFGLALVAIVSSFVMVMTDLNRLFDQGAGIAAAIGFTLPPAFLWSYDDALWRRERSGFRLVARSLAIVFLAGLSSVLSFHDFWTSPFDRMALSAQLAHLLSPDFWLNPNLLVLTLLTLAQWLYGLYSSRSGRWRLAQVDAGILGILLAIALVTFWHWSVTPIQIIAVVIYNLILFLLGIGLLRQGLADGNRLRFWSGLGLLTLQILTRLLEYETGLLLKSLVFALCGAAVIAFGLWFERVRQLRHSS